MLSSSLKHQQPNLSAAEFYCPSCHTRRSYEVKQAAEVDLVCVLPFFHPTDNAQVLECQICKNGFDVAILHPSNQSLFKLVAAARAQLLTGTSPGSLKVRLISDGLKEEFIDKLISLALH
jgi:hypothetical protein